MRVKLSKNWRRYQSGKELTGGAAREALAENAGVVMKKADEKADTKD